MTMANAVGSLANSFAASNTTPGSVTSDILSSPQRRRSAINLIKTHGQLTPRRLVKMICLIQDHTEVADTLLALGDDADAETRSLFIEVQLNRVNTTLV